uniref:Huntingtin interacting protein 1 related b n=1 Tax=Cyclopterus lumpus TaxID=8103 RepID=A0A8C2Z1T4_CYCLU
KNLVNHLQAVQDQRLIPLLSFQLSSISKAINSTEMPVKEKHARRIILGTHREKGAYTFWSYALGFPLASSSILSWKFCHVLHKVLRDGHRNVRHQVALSYCLLLSVDDSLYASVISLLVIRQLNTSIAISTLSSGQCRLSPLIQVIQDCSHLYHFTVKLLFKLHACLPADTLQGHRDRFHDQFHSLKTFFNKTRDMLYFKRLIQIPKLPDSPPNFLHAASLAKHVKPVVVIPDEYEPEQQEDDDDDPEPLIEVTYYDCFISGRDLQIESLKQDLELLRAELEKVKAEAQRYITQLKSQINSLEAELEDQRAQKQHALVENEQLRMELEATRRRNAEHESTQSVFIEAENRAQATEQRYNKLREKHTELVSSHAELLRKSADTVKMLSATQQTQEEVERTKQQLSFEVDRIKQEAEMKVGVFSLQEHGGHLPLLASLIALSLCQTSEQMNSSVTALQAEKDRLMRSASEKEAELSSLRQAAQAQQSSLQQERERNSRELGDLQGKLQEKTNLGEQLNRKLLEEQFALLQGTVTEAENIIQDAVAKLEDPLHIRCTSSPDYLISRAEAALGSVDKVKKGHADYLSNMGDAGGLLRALTQFSHLTADTIINGSATAHTAPPDHADRLTENCRGCATQSLQFFKDLKSKTTLQRADPASIRVIIQKILNLGQELRPKGMDVRQDELGDLVDKEMAATSAAIEEAVRRIDEMMDQARKDTSGIKLEVNERFAIRMLIISSTDLQKEIVEGGRGAATMKEFYARNSRWTEGLISAAKAVGWGATEMVESADKVVLHTGKYEELIVCSHEIAASTAQLVAASKVKAERNSKRLSVLQQASRHVNEMAANVVASTRTGQEHLEDKETMDFSGLSVIKLRKEEMESQVKVLELESHLGKERMRLGELRKKHYELTSLLDHPVTMSPKPSKPVLLKKPALSQKPNMPPKTTVRGVKKSLRVACDEI